MHEYTPLFLAISVPTVIGIVGLILNRSDFNAVRSELTGVRERLTAVETDTGLIKGMLGIPVKAPAAQKR